MSVAVASKAFAVSNGAAAASGAAAVAAGDAGGSSSSSSSSEMMLMRRRMSRSSSFSDIDSEDEHDEEGKEEVAAAAAAAAEELDLGPIIPLKQQLELDKEDESLRRWKEQLLGCTSSLQLDPLDGGRMEPEVKLLTLGIIAEGRPEMTLPLPFPLNSRGHAFTLKEGCCYCLRFAFVVRHNIVSGLTYVNTVWKNGLRVDHTRTMLGAFGPQAEPYTHVTEEEMTPSGILARGSYSARTKFLDDDKRCYLELDYTFEIRKDWH